jgi:3-deoxy-D-manno-octulosonic-acid transferase
MDSRENAKRFLDLVKPSMVIFVKYEFWYYYLQAIKKRNIPLLLVSAVFRKEQPFFKWYGVLHRKMLSFFTHIFVQNDGSKQLLSEIGLKETTSVSGDTRFDRVMEIAADHQVNPDIEAFVGGNKLMIAGSTWKNDEEMIAQVTRDLNDPLLKLIIAPHEIDANHLKEINKLFPDSIYYSEFKKAVSEMKSKNVLIIDNIGLLSRLYRYSYISYVGGGFTRDGVHNVPEAAVYGRPVMFGPNFQKYSEAIELIESGGGLSVSSPEDMVKQVSILLVDQQVYRERSKASRNYIMKKTGAVEKIIQYIQENRLLTN